MLFRSCRRAAHSCRSSMRSARFAPCARGRRSGGLMRSASASSASRRAATSRPPRARTSTRATRRRSSPRSMRWIRCSVCSSERAACFGGRRRSRREGRGIARAATRGARCEGLGRERPRARRAHRAWRAHQGRPAGDDLGTRGLRRKLSDSLTAAVLFADLCARLISSASRAAEQSARQPSPDPTTVPRSMRLENG